MRQREGLFLAEGPQAVREAIGHRPDVVRDVYADPTATSRYADLLAAAEQAGVRAEQVSAAVLEAMSDTTHPQGLLAVCRPVDVDLAQVLDADPAQAFLGRPGFVVILTHVRDPGNAGTVIRGADAAGASAVLVSDASVDVYNPKVVRSTVGSLFHLPVVVGIPATELLDRVSAAGFVLLAADGTGELLLSEAPLDQPHAWVMGNEAWGLEANVQQRCDHVVRVPIYGHAESLNLAMAATLCLYASARAQDHPRQETGAR